MMRSVSPTPSCASMRSDISKYSEQSQSRRKESEGMKNLAEKKKFHEDLVNIFRELENRVITFMKHELERFKKLLRNDNIKYYDKGVDDNYDAREGALNIALHFLRKMNQIDLADSLEKCPIELCQQKLKSNLKKKYKRVLQGISQQGKSELLEKIYTDLFITEGRGDVFSSENEISCIEKATRTQDTEEKPIECNSIFQPLPGEEKAIRLVLTNGVAGIGKSISVQKFILDWANGVENQEIELIFPLPFRELNLKKEKYSLMEILHQFFPETKGMMFTKRKDYKVLFIFDGLDECRHPLQFKKNEIWSDLTTPTSMDVLLTNLIKGNLLPNALIWITSRPAAANHIPPECIDLVSEVRGFNDEQKEEYFRKKIEDQMLAERVIKLIKESRSLYIMCHIPIFCWICATVFETILLETESSRASKQQILNTLTQMYLHFLIFQTKRKTEKYDDEKSSCCGSPQWDEKGTRALGQLAFDNLLDNNLIFCDSDLTDCGISVEDAFVYSGMCTQIFKEDSGILFGTAFSFVHLSIQEFMAALYAHICMSKDNRNVFADEDTCSEKETNMTDLLKNAVDKALNSNSGQLDLFLRFLLGLSLESNQKLLPGLLTYSERTSQSKEEIVKHIKDKLKENLSAERSINLFYCLNELNDKSLVDDIQNQLKSGSLSCTKLSPAQWSALVFVLQTSEKVIEDFDLKKFQRSDECLKRLLPVVKTATKARLDNCCLTQESCLAIAKILSSSSLKELDLSGNAIKDIGVEILACELQNPQCKLETLRLSKGSITGEGYALLASALRRNLHLKELDMGGNDPGDSGVKLLTGLQKDSICKLDTVRFYFISHCDIFFKPSIRTCSRVTICLF
ncbi:NLR family CARD domain-containing protein 3-like [Engraulis encrasicolus]|uniref:NLR family CARD domain-containing protein 3-like n=1 Tax=Engraulis encrasicolus TaxID=184585 RepID=UPI002FD2BFE2